MSWLLVVAAAIAADSRTASEVRPLHEFHHQISELLKREAQASDLPARAAVIRAMCGLHREIVRDERFSTSDKLKEYRGRLWSRLMKIKADLKQQLAREAKTTSGDMHALDDLAVLESAEPAALAATDSLADSLSLLDQTQGGPSYWLARGGRAQADANGRELIELIERTINPNFWETNGGPGSIYYYGQLQCLVVRATSEVHDQLGGLAGGLRQAGP